MARRTLAVAYERSVKPRLVRDGDCLIYSGHVGRGGIGNVGANGKTMSVHRITYQAVYGPIPKGLHVMHACDRPACCNPQHLSLGTHADNMADMVRKRRQAKGEQIQKKLTAHDVIAMRHLRDYGVSYRSLAKLFSVSSRTAVDIAGPSPVVWRHLLPDGYVAPFVGTPPRLIEWQGSTRTMAEWSQRTGLSRETIHGRLKRGWHIERALSTPVPHV